MTEMARQIRSIAFLSIFIGFFLFGGSARAQSAADSLATEQESRPSRDEGELIELEAVEIEGEIALPHVAITVSRQEPLFREISLRRTPPQGLTDLGIELQTLEAAKIVNWSEILERPR